jgi:hypothetical protein
VSGSRKIPIFFLQKKWNSQPRHFQWFEQISDANPSGIPQSHKRETRSTTVDRSKKKWFIRELTQGEG